MKNYSRYLFLVIPLVMLATMIFPSHAYAQDGGTAPDVPAAPTAPGSAGSVISNPTSPSSASPSAECTSPGIYGDPWFKVGLTTYYFLPLLGTCPLGTSLGTTCFKSPTPVQDAINWISAFGHALPTDKKIYVEAGTYSESATINGAAGNGLLASLIGVIGHGSSDTTMTGSISILNTKSGFNVSGFNLASFAANNNVGAINLSDLVIRSGGIVVNSNQGAISLNNIISTGTFGANLGNDGYLTAYPVTITNSEFDDNYTLAGTYGLMIVTKGAVKLNGVSASGNKGTGVSISGGSSFTINNLLTSDNYFSGDGFSLFTNAVAPVTMTNVFSNGNYSNGLSVYSKGAITLANIEALNNINGTGIKIGDFANPTGAVKVTNANANANGLDGLSVYSKSSITLDTVSAVHNQGGNGVYLDNCLETTPGKCTGTGAVSVTSKTINNFDENFQSGIYIRSSGAITLSDFTAVNNQFVAVAIGNAYTGAIGGVTVKTSLPGSKNLIASTNNGGLGIDSNGPIIVANTDSVGNRGYGASLVNYYPTLIGQPVTITNSSFDKNTVTDGLWVLSKGAISLTNVSASGNVGSGATLNNTSGTAPVSVLPGLDGSMTSFSANNVNGLKVLSKGVITIKSVQANGNVETGIFADNSAGLPTVGVTIQNAIVNFNDGLTAYGMEIYSRGVIALSGLEANYNSMSGVNVDNCLRITDPLLGEICSGSGAVNLLGGRNTFSYNGELGLHIVSKGAISVSNLNASDNIWQGVWLDNQVPGSTSNITVTAPIGSVNQVTGNGFFPNHTTYLSGMQLNSYGNITLERTASNFNGNFGFAIFNNEAGVPRAITITDSSADDNQRHGFYINGKAGVTLKGVSADNNSFVSKYVSYANSVSDRLTYSTSNDYYYFNGTTGDNINYSLESSDFNVQILLVDPNGTTLRTDGGPATPSVSINYPALPLTGLYHLVVRSYLSSGKGNYDLKLWLTGSPLPSLTAPYSTGVSVNTSGDVSILSTGTTGAIGNNNANNGVEVRTSGKVTGTNVGGSYNGYSGVLMVNTTGVASSITLTGGTANNNGTYGYALETKGFLTVSNLIANAQGRGFSLWNNGAATNLPVTATNISASNNSSDGIYIASKGAITISNIYTNSNYTGATLQSLSGGAISVKSASGYNKFLSNTHNGLVISTTGAVTLDKIDARNQGWNGIDIQSAGSVTLTNSNILYSGQSGILVSTNGAVLLNNVVAISNGVPGLGSLFDGIRVYNHPSLKPVTITNSVFMGNARAGINVIGCGPSTLLLTNTFYFGNNTNHDTLTHNLWCQP